MVQTVELLLDDETDALVQRQWTALNDAGLPSQARHTGAANRPHVTCVVQDDISEVVERQLADAATALPIGIRLGALTVFGRSRYILVRPLVPDRALLDLQARLQHLAGPPAANMAPGEWSPHVTLARRMTPQQVGDALTVLSGIPEQPQTPSYAVSARRWDAEAKREWPLRP